MAELKIIFVREFLARVRTRPFVLSTLLMPILLAAAMALPQIIGGGSERHLAVINEAHAQIGPAFAAALQATPESSRENRYVVELVKDKTAVPLVKLDQRVVRAEIDGYVVIPADILERGVIEYHARSISSPQVNAELGRAASRATQSYRLGELGIDLRQLQALTRPVTVDGTRVSRLGAQQGSTAAAFFLAYAVAISTYMLTLVYGVNLLRSVLEEKTQRVAEVILSTISSGYFLAGKVFGATVTALLQLSIWVLAAVAIAGGLGGRIGVSPEVLSMFAVEPAVALSLGAFFVFGFLLYASLFSALGAAVSSEQEAQSWQTVAIVPLVLPMLFLRVLTNDPSGTASMLLGLFPLTSPIAMAIRLATEPVAPLQVVLSLALLILSLIGTLWLAGRIFRIGILSTGAKPTATELWHWLKAS